MRTPPHRTIARIATGVVAAIAAVLSWDASASVSAETHAVAPGLAWLVPGVIEAGVVALAVTAWTAAAAGRRARLETWTAGGLLALSTVIQIARVVIDGGTWLGMTIAAVIPGVLLVCAHGLLADVRRRGGTRKSTPAPAPRTRPAQAPAAAPAVAAVERSAPRGTDRSAIIERLIAQHGGLDMLTGPIVAAECGVTPSTGRRILARARERAGEDLAA